MSDTARRDTERGRWRNKRVHSSLFDEDGAGAALDVTEKLNYTPRETQKQAEEHQELGLS